jgi:hypothetical protein
MRGLFTRYATLEAGAMALRKGLIGFWACISLMFLLGCATVVTDSQQVTDASKATYDPYTNFHKITGMKLNKGGFPNITRFWMRGGFDKSGSNEFIQLYVHHWSQTGWNFFNSASDITGTPLNVHQLAREVESGANVREEIAIDLPRNFLESRKAQGLNIKIQGNRGDMIIEIPPAYITGYLEKYDSEMEKKGFTTGRAKVQPEQTDKSKGSQTDLDGFRGIKWGTDVSTINGLTIYKGSIEGGKDIQFYIREGDDLKLGGVDLDKIVYGFWKNKLLSVRLFAKGLANWSLLKTVSTEKFGKSYETPNLKNTYAWLPGKASVFLRYKEDNGEATLIIAGTEILAQKLNEEKETSRKAAAKGF